MCFEVDDKMDMDEVDMTVDKMIDIFSSFLSYTDWHVQLLRIKTDKNNKTIYTGREISLDTSDAMKSLVDEISKRYSNSKNGILRSYTDVRKYDGSTINDVIYWLKSNDVLISDDYNNLLKAIGNPDSELNPLDFDFQACMFEEYQNDCRIKLISIKSPFVFLKHKFFASDGTFKEISGKVLSLSTTIDVVIIDDVVFLLTLDGEKLFNMKRAYKISGKEKVDDIIKKDLVSDGKLFSSEAMKGVNPRRLVSLNKDHLNKLTNINNRKNIAQKFNIPMVGDVFDTAKSDTTDKLIKVLCDRGMVDPFDNDAMEVAGSKKWK